MSAAAEQNSSSAGAGGAAGGDASSAGGSKLVMILTLVNTLVTMAIVAILLVSFNKSKSTPSIADMQAHGDEHGGSEAKGGEHGAAGGHGEAGVHGLSAGKKAANLGKMVTLEQFTVNLSTPGSGAPKFVRVNVSLEVDTDDAEAEVTGKMPQIRNSVIDLFNSKRASDLSTVDGRDYLREEIRNALNNVVMHGKVKNVFFTNFMVTG